jgi:hypothetical protein
MLRLSIPLVLRAAVSAGAILICFSTMLLQSQDIVVSPSGSANSETRYVLSVDVDLARISHRLGKNRVLKSAERGFLHGSLWSGVIVGGNAYEVVTAEQAFAKEAGKTVNSDRRVP